jgi:DNA-binding SARP family transcriptional activator
MAVQRLQLLGAFACESSGSVVDLPFGMQRLVAFLALRGPSHRCLVAGSLWPEVRESQALASLRTGVWRINKALPGVLRTENAALDVSSTTEVDARKQEVFATTLLRTRVDDPDWLQAGLPSLWLGELLPGWYDDWVVFERERLSQLRLHALEFTARVMTQRNQLDTALQLALEAVRAEPLRETANAVLMSVYLAEGNVSDAIHQYDAFRGLLQRELGLEPSPRLAELLPRQRATLTWS